MARPDHKSRPSVGPGIVITRNCQGSSILSKMAGRALSVCRRGKRFEDESFSERRPDVDTADTSYKRATPTVGNQDDICNGGKSFYTLLQTHVFMTVLSSRCIAFSLSPPFFPYCVCWADCTVWSTLPVAKDYRTGVENFHQV